MGALTIDKLLIIGIIAMLIFGPERLPMMAEQLARLIKRAKAWTTDAKARVSDELGEDFTDEDWRKLDPRQYDPRRIIRDAWNEMDAPARPSSAGMASASTGAAVAAAMSGIGASSRPAWAAAEAATPLVPGEAPFDSEAT
ncbi:Sec-independent protein translocase TatB [Gulosibacter macacae]|uniref:Sec-independent protein translocase TatB n=1 Tax=Gulosibacter macacae TaxID=2488791 RepID=A0A3P3W235_9MICO|nr:twin-arginine translocase TatA/TatE family subunit [Gulosibacter macacae]RRJ88587.1 Sec-independent protein translocase TatB [Gulosibacter macacae]